MHCTRYKKSSVDFARYKKSSVDVWCIGIAFILNIELLSILCKIDLADITISNALLGPRPTTETSSF